MSRLLSIVKSVPLAWWLFLVILIILITLIGTGRWQGAAVGSQVQVPMFYDDHYVYPRPWSQDQAAPGVPPPAQLSVLYEENQISQTFVSRADHLSLLKIWLSGLTGTIVEARLLSSDGEEFLGQITLDSVNGQYYFLSLPELTDTKGDVFSLELSAPTATALQPVSTRSIGGDKLGGPLYLNEYPRPGNLEIYTYHGANPGQWWFEAVGEQILPAVFALRLQQYKPKVFKGSAFSLLLGFTFSLSIAFLFLSRLKKSYWSKVLGWSLVTLIAAFLGVELFLGRLVLPELIQTQPLRTSVMQTSLDLLPRSTNRLVYDLSMLLWTADREPEARFTEVTTDMTGRSAIRVPGNSTLAYSLSVPLNSTLKVGLASYDYGGTRFIVGMGEETILSQEVYPSQGTTWVELALSPWAGQGQTLLLRTLSSTQEQDADALWIMPQIKAEATWLLDKLPDEDRSFQEVDFRFQASESEKSVKLVGLEVEESDQGSDCVMVVTLYWLTTDRLDQYATVFVHLLDEDGKIQAQHDGQPVKGTYPLPSWPPGSIISDEHLLISGRQPSASILAVGLYDPGSGRRWSAYDRDGKPIGDDQVMLQLPKVMEAVP